MSATPRPIMTTWHVDGAKRISLVDMTQEEADRIILAVNAFDALLAVAKAASVLNKMAPTLRPPSALGDAQEILMFKLMALDATHPDWLEWSTHDGSRVTQA